MPPGNRCSRHGALLSAKTGTCSICSVASLFPRFSDISLKTPQIQVLGQRRSGSACHWIETTPRCTCNQRNSCDACSERKTPRSIICAYVVIKGVAPRNAASPVLHSATIRQLDNATTVLWNADAWNDGHIRRPWFRHHSIPFKQVTNLVKSVNNRIISRELDDCKLDRRDESFPSKSQQTLPFYRSAVQCVRYRSLDKRR